MISADETRTRRWRLTILIVAVVSVSLAHYTTPVGDHFTHAYHANHALYQWFYYLPIILAGFWFGIRGGFGFAALVTILYTPHVLIQWNGGMAEQWLEIALYNIVGWVVGTLSDRQKAGAEKYRKAAHALDDAYTELKERTRVHLETEDQLRRADRLTALGQLSAGLAHEIKTPLSSVRGAAELLAKGGLPPEEQSEFLGILVREADRLNRVVVRFLDFANPREWGEASADPVRAIREVLDLLRVEAGRQGVEILREIPEEVPPVAMDGEELRQVILNLAMNGVQAMEGGGRLGIALTKPDNGSVTLSVTDTGNGIPDELLPRIFDPFVTGRSSGTGLGLSIVQRILANHGASIHVESAAGRGTTMEVTIPVKEPQHVA